MEGDIDNLPRYMFSREVLKHNPQWPPHNTPLFREKMQRNIL